MLNCREIGSLVATEELAEGSWLKKLEVRMHLLMCRYCSRYANQLRKLGLAAKSLWSGPVTDEEREAARRIKQRLWSDPTPDYPSAHGDDS